MKTKQEICVPIRNEEELQQAKDMLEKNGEKIDEETFKVTSEDYNYLYFHTSLKDWGLGNPQDKTEIPLSELESVLKGESDEKKNSIELFKKPFRQGHVKRNVIVDANGHVVFSLNSGQYKHDDIIKILNSIND